MVAISRSTLLKVLGIISVAGCVYGLPRLLFDPRPAILQTVQYACQGHGQITNLNILRIHNWANGKLVLYRATCQSQQPDEISLEINGDQQFVLQGLTWLAANGGSVGHPLHEQPPSNQSIQIFDRSQSGNQDYVYSTLYGEILDSNVASVELRLSNGETLRDDGKGDVFFFVAPGTPHLCDLQALDADGRVLQNQSLVDC